MDSIKTRKKNCWELIQCGRQPGGNRVQELGPCPAATEEILDGANEGDNAGRACWVVAGTLCRGKVEGSFARKLRSCQECVFYLLVKAEEGDRIEEVKELREKLKNPTTPHC